MYVLKRHTCAHSQLEHLSHIHSCRADKKWDSSSFLIYYTTRDKNNANLTVNLYKSDHPYTSHSLFDPKLGSHDAFVIVGPYIFAQRTDKGVIGLHVSYNRQPFRNAMIPTPYAHQNYIVSHINELQALVIIGHEGNFYNLYLSDQEGVYYSLALRDLVVERGRGLDLELVSVLCMYEHSSLWSTVRRKRKSKDKKERKSP